MLATEIELELNPVALKASIVLGILNQFISFYFETEMMERMAKAEPYKKSSLY